MDIWIDGSSPAPSLKIGEEPRHLRRRIVSPLVCCKFLKQKGSKLNFLFSPFCIVFGVKGEIVFFF